MKSPRTCCSNRRPCHSGMAVAMIVLYALGCLLPMSPARAQHWERRGVLPQPVCGTDSELVSWPTLQRELGVHVPQRFGNSEDRDAPAHQLRRAWRLLQHVDLPGVGNAAEFVAQHINSMTLDARMFGGVRAEFRHSSRTLMLAPEFFDDSEQNDVARASTLLHEARHAQDRRYRHVICPTSSSMAWMAQCDQHFRADSFDPEAGAWSLEVAFLAQLAATKICPDSEDLRQRIESRLKDAFRNVDAAERARFSRQTRGLLRPRGPGDEVHSVRRYGRN